jgi:hypothetical protein
MAAVTTTIRSRARPINRVVVGVGPRPAERMALRSTVEAAMVGTSATGADYKTASVPLP